MILKTFCGGSFQVNNYIIACENTKKAALIDSGGFDHDKIYSFLDENHLNLECLLLTHGHLDHVCGAKRIQEKRKVPVYLHEEDHFLLEMLSTQLAFYGMPPAEPVEDITNLKDSQIIALGDIQIHVIHTPGHSPGSVCYYLPEEKKIFAGDLLFAASIGRTDLPGGSYEQIMESLHNKIVTLPYETVVYCGHGPETSIGEEASSNPFLVKDTRV